MNAVPLLDLKPQYRALESEILAVLHEVAASQGFILGPRVEAFERAVASFVGVEHAIGCASGTDALVLSLAALGVGPGDEVVTTPFSFFASASCASLLGAKPVFSDIEPETFNLDPARLEEAITPRTKAIVAVHLFGQCADMDRILEVAERHGVPVVEDAAQSLSAEYRSERHGGWRQSGSMGATGTYSFFPSKNLGAFGDGGMIVTNDGALAATLKQLRVHGEVRRYHHAKIGWNSRLDALQAAVLQVKLPHLPAWSRGRAANADRYDRLFAEAGLVESGAVRLPARDPKCRHIFNQYTLRVRDRDRLAEHLTAQGIGWAIYYPVPLHLQECFRSLGQGEGSCPIAEQAGREVISLPVFPELTAEQQERVVAAIAS